MHLFIATEGDDIYTNRFISELRSTYVDAEVPKKVREEAKKRGINNPSVLNQIQVREIRFFDIVFPKEALDVTLHRLRPFGSPDSKVEKWMNKLLVPIRKLIGFKKIDVKDHRAPSEVMVKNNIRYPPIMHPYVRILPIGIKDDYTSISQECEAL